MMENNLGQKSVVNHVKKIEGLVNERCKRNCENRECGSSEHPLNAPIEGKICPPLSRENQLSIVVI
jgi:hypothetical protein